MSAKPTLVRPPRKASDYCTRAEAEAIAVKVAEFYAQQVPSMIERVLIAKADYDREQRWHRRLARLLRSSR